MDEWIQCVGRKPYKDFSIALKRWLESDNVGRKSEQAQETDFDVDKYKIFINNF